MHAFLDNLNILPFFIRSTGLIIGAGGTAMAAAYALKHLELDIFVYNRTVEKAKAVFC
jgi:shikimate 5-dehydrogenase